MNHPAANFQQQATEWIGAIAAIALLLINTYYSLKNNWQTQANKERLDRHGEMLRGKPAPETPNEKGGEQP